MCFRIEFFLKKIEPIFLCICVTPTIIHLFLATMQKRLHTALLMVFLGINAYAQIGGSGIYPFLNVPIAPRVAGAAGATIANTDDDANFGLINPALIQQNLHGHMSMSLAPMKGDVLFGEAVYSHSFEKVGSFLVGIKYVDYGDFLTTNTQAQVIGGFTAADYAFQAGYGYALDSNWQFGAAVKLLNSTYESYISWGLATDISAMYLIPKKRIAMTLMLRNLGTQLSTFDGNREPLPLDLRFGISTKFEHVPLRLNLMLDQLQKFDLSYNDPNKVVRDPITGEVRIEETSTVNKILRHITLAGEISGKNINAQLGYSFRRANEMDVPTVRSSAGLTFGFGIRISKFRINYANTNMNVAGRMNHFGITTSLGNFKPKPAPLEK